MSFPLSVEDWLALPEVPIRALSSATEPGQKHRVLKVGVCMLPLTLCRKAGLGDIPAETADKAALPTATLQHAGGPKLYRLPWQLGGWAVDLVGLAQHAGVRFLPADVEFRNLDGRITAGTGRGDEYEIRSWAKKQH